MTRPTRRFRVVLCALVAAVASAAVASAAVAAPAPASRDTAVRGATLRAGGGVQTEPTRGRTRGRLFTLRRGLGVAFLAGGVVLARKGFDLRDEADDFYARYKAATDESEISKFYQRTTNRDVKSQVSWALAAACGFTGLRLLITHDGGAAARAATALGPPRPGASALSLTPTITPRAVSLDLRRSFY